MFGLILLTAKSAGPDLDTIGRVNLIPWHHDALWQAANAAIAYHLDRHAQQVKPVVETAHSLTRLLAELGTVFDDLCRAVCPVCPHPCCQVATPWFDFKDLLYLHLSGQSVPEAQPRVASDITCRYYRPSGCCLGRLRRPWICAWYICPSQKRCLQEKTPAGLSSLDTQLLRIKGLRRAMERAYLTMILPARMAPKDPFLFTERA